MGKLDDAWHTVNEESRQASKSFATVVRAYATAADQMATKKHDMQAAERDAAWANFIAIHTGPDGRLVSKDKAGAVQPLLATDLTAALVAREERSTKLAASRASWAAVHGPLFEAIGKFDAMIDLTGKTEGDIIAGKHSIAALVQEGATFVGGVLSAAGFLSAL